MDSAVRNLILEPAEPFGFGSHSLSWWREFVGAAGHRILIVLLLVTIVGTVQAQRVTFRDYSIRAPRGLDRPKAEAGGVDFGDVNVCPSGQTGPAPCSQTLTLNYIVGSTTTFGPIGVVTQGAPNLDFTLSAGSTCVGTVSAGSSCTVNATFAPIAPGLRMGAVQLFDSSGNLLTTTMVQGVGQGPVIEFLPGIQTGVGSELTTQTGVAVDAAGDVFVAEQGLRGEGSEVVKVTPLGLPNHSGHGISSRYRCGSGWSRRCVYCGPIRSAGGGGARRWGAQTTVGSGLHYPTGVAVDGAGNLFIADTGNNRVVEVPAGGGTQTVLPAIGLNFPQGVAVDRAGDVFIADTKNNRVVEVSAGGSQTTVGTGLIAPTGVAVDAAGDVFIACPEVIQQGAPHRRKLGLVAEVAPSGAQTTPVSGTNVKPFGIAVDGAGDLFIGDEKGLQVLEVQGSLRANVQLC